MRPFVRRILELLYDGQSEAAGDVAAAPANIRPELVAERQRLAVPPDAKVLDGLVNSYSSPELGHLTVRRSGPDLVFDFGAWNTFVSSRKNQDGTTSFVATSPGVLSLGLDFLVASRMGKCALVIRDQQYEYVYLGDN